MKTLKWISDTEVSVISIIKFIGDFDIKVDNPKCIKIKCLSINNAKTIYKNFGDDCTDSYKKYLMYHLMFSEVDEYGYVKFLLEHKSNMSFAVTYHEGYTTVEIALVKEVMKVW
jgi:hypothetical protein